MRATRRGPPRGPRPPRPAGPPHEGAVLTTTAPRPSTATAAVTGPRRWVRPAVLVVLVLLVVTQRIALPLGGRGGVLRKRVVLFVS